MQPTWYRRSNDELAPKDSCRSASIISFSSSMRSSRTTGQPNDLTTIQPIVPIWPCPGPTCMLVIVTHKCSSINVARRDCGLPSARRQIIQFECPSSAPITEFIQPSFRHNKMFAIRIGRPVSTEPAAYRVVPRHEGIRSERKEDFGGTRGPTVTVACLRLLAVLLTRPE